MRFAIATVDRYLGVFEAFVRAGWEPLRLFTLPVANRLDGHEAVVAFAEKNGADVQFERLSERDLACLRERGCDALVVANYAWRVPDWRSSLRYAVNFHASPLPLARGPYPVNRAILERRSHWAVTCHRLAPEFDTGDILAADPFPLHADECHESLDLKIQMAAKRLATRVAHGFDDLWERATPQGPGQYWPNPAIADRVLDFAEPVEAIMLKVRAFGATGSLARVNGVWFVLVRGLGWSEPHDLAVGSLVHVHNGTFVVAASDGYIAVLEGEVPSAEVLAQLDPAPATASNRTMDAARRCMSL